MASMLPATAHERFEILGRLGSGSFGSVYEAFDRYRNRIVALKVLERASADGVARFKREFRTLAEVRHSNLASLYELLVVSDHWILTMELIRGTELLEHLATAELQHSFVELRSPTLPGFDLDQTIKLRRQKSVVSPVYIDHVRETFRQLAVAIAVLHAYGIVHRDIKPSNIMITPEGRVVLLDFGLAVGIAADDSLDRQVIVGTPGYMSPEQISASSPSAASDWYAFGVLLFQALSGRMPFIAPSSLEVMEAQVHGEPARATEIAPAVPHDLALLADDCIKRDPASRPSDVEVLGRLGIRQFDPMRPIRKRTRRPDRIGRGRELRALRSCIALAQRGGPRVILLHGSAGSGKSTMIDLLLDELRRETNTLIISGQCEAWESVRFNAIDSLLDSLAREFRRDRPPTVDVILNRALAVAQVFPALVATPSADTGEETISVPPKGEKLIARATAELRSVLAAASGDRGLLLTLDDAQWGDYQSGQMMLRLLELPNLVLLLSYRSEDWRTSLFLQALVGSGIPMREVHLGELSRAMTAQILRSATGRGNQRLADAIYRQTSGNPALIDMVVDAVLSGAKEPRSLLARAVALRMQRLSAPARQLFQFLLARDGPIHDALAASALEFFESDEPLRTLRRERLIRVRKTGDLQEIDVYHRKMREALTARRRRKSARSELPIAQAGVRVQ